MNWPCWLWCLVVSAYFALVLLGSWLIGSTARWSRGESRGDIRNKINLGERDERSGDT